MATFDVEYKTEATGDAVQSKLFESNAGTIEEVAEEFQKAHPEATDVIQVIECDESEGDDDEGDETDIDNCPECGEPFEDCTCGDEEEGEDLDDDLDEDEFEDLDSDEDD